MTEALERNIAAAATIGVRTPAMPGYTPAMLSKNAQKRFWRTMRVALLGAPKGGL
jgi:hypothetical protein